MTKIKVNDKSRDLNKLFYDKEKTEVLEVMLGLNAKIKPAYSATSNEIILNKNNVNTTLWEDYFFVNPHLSNQERYQSYLNYLKKKAIKAIDALDIKPDNITELTTFTPKKNSQAVKTDCSDIDIPCLVFKFIPKLVIPQSIESLPEEKLIQFEARTSKYKAIFFCKANGIYTYEQPSSQLVKKYIESNWQAPLPDEFPDDEYILLQYLKWVRQVLSNYEDQNTHSLPAVLSYELSTKLSKQYPNVPSAVDFFNSLVRHGNAEVRVDKGYTVYNRHQPFIEMLISGIQELRRRSYDYYKKSDRQFLNEIEITRNLYSLIKEPDGVVKELEVKDGMSSIDLLLRSKDSIAELAVEAKIACKNGKLCTSGISDALFEQAPAYAERLNCDACVVFYILDGDLLTVTVRVCEIVKSKFGWSISPKRAEKAPKHYVLTKESGGENVTLLIDVLFVCLPSQSNTQKSRSNK